jgi:hypothetical protein
MRKYSIKIKLLIIEFHIVAGEIDDEITIYFSVELSPKIKQFVKFVDETVINPPKKHIEVTGFTAKRD